MTVMSDNALMKITDGFEGYEDGIEGDEPQQGGGVIHGAVVKFTNESTWITRSGEELPPDLELIAVDIGRVVQKWKDQQPVETIVLEPGQKFPNIEELNNKTPRSEWTEGPDKKDKKLRGPWQAQHIIYLLNAATMDRYSFPTGTTGGAIATRDLVDKTKWMRRFRGQHVYPVVTLSDTFMNTRFGGRQRPHFLIKRWVDLGADEKALPAPEPPSSPPAAAQEALEHVVTDEKPTPDNEAGFKWGTIYRGYDINAHNGRWLVSKDGKEVHRAENKDAAVAWVDNERAKTYKRGTTSIDAPALKTVEEPSLSEQMDDDIPSEGGRGKSGRKAPRSPEKLMPPV
jgi:hypothetical protein